MLYGFGAFENYLFQLFLLRESVNLQITLISVSIHDIQCMCRRPLIIYDANEVKQWLEARKKNYPTSVNVNKVNYYLCVSFY
jgi:hypothetical protein